MRKATWLMMLGWMLAVPAVHAGDSLRVGNRVLVTGDSAVTVTELLGQPSYRSRARTTANRSRGRGHTRKRRRTPMADAGAMPGDRWQYHRDGRVIVVTLVDGRVTDIDERVR